MHCYQYIDPRTNYVSNVTWEPTVIPADLTLAYDTCPKTVAFAFLVQSGLPLKKVWQEYFDSCIPGYYMTLVHTQDPDAWVGEKFMRDTIVLPKELTVPDSSLRYGFEMVNATLNLMATALQYTLEGSSCRPAWVHIVSDSCIPLTDCRSFQLMLASHSSRSFVRVDKLATPYEIKTRTKGVNLPIESFRKNAPWVTLRAADIDVFLAKRLELYAIWKDAFVPSEHYFSVNFVRENLPTWRRQLTFVSFGNHSLV